MSKQDSLKQHLELKNAHRTWFQWQEQKHTVKDAPAETFDAWIREFVEEIVNVDTATWSVFHRWNIINAVLKEGLLVIINGDTLERPPEVDTSEKEVASLPAASGERTMR